MLEDFDSPDFEIQDRRLFSLDEDREEYDEYEFMDDSFNPNES